MNIRRLEASRPVPVPADPYELVYLPGGQFEWLEHETRLPFAATIAETLILGKEGVGW